MQYANRLNDLKKALLQDKDLVASLLPGQSNFSTVTLFLLAALQRIDSNVAGFQAMVASLNYPVACAILRLQIDTAMRVNGLRLMADPHDGTMKLLSGERYDRIRPKKGDKLRDAVLLNSLNAEYDWIKKVYERTSGMVHLSGMHIHHSFNHSTGVKNEDGSLSIEMAIGPNNPNVPAELYDEICAAFVHVSMIANEITVTRLRHEQAALNPPQA
ncbi:hypothetical protein [Agrobacterium sp. ST15.13.015]|uniref:hypothetical protein n=1 Tax=Agrobacterium sp. ST15.13.015 TaxID=3017319 RepID=UPI0022C6BE01|nr:hypothetical protein [Agrobacterium sp. ST15.13.015]MCZ7502758.1 hypothetical protein [Rhizobium rhizogenes]